MVIDTLARRLAADNLPGFAALSAMAAVRRDWTPREVALAAGCREACAAVVVYPGDPSSSKTGDWHVVLTRRAAALRDHAGQVSFPGGRLENGESRSACALRELQEEVSVPPPSVAVLGELTGLYIPPSHFWVYPVVLAASTRPPFRPQQGEVDEVLEVPLDRLLAPSARRVEVRELLGAPRRVPFWFLAGHKVWGATAMILAELAVLWSEVAWRINADSKEGRGE